MPGKSHVRQSTARYGQSHKCAILGCGEMAVPGGVYCFKCRGLVSQSLDREEESTCLSDIHALALRDALKGMGSVEKLLESYETHPCGLCGGPALIGRQYCSDKCRASARIGNMSEIEVDGIIASLLEHAERLGINKSTVYKRMKKGMSPIEALKKPIDEEMRRRSLCC